MNRKSKAAEFVTDNYNVSITGRNVQVTDSIKEYAIEKVSRVERYIDRIIEIAVVLELQKIEHRVDITVKFHNVTIKSHAITDDMYASIDAAVHKLESRLRKYKSRINNHYAKNHAVADMNVSIFSALAEAENAHLESQSEDAAQENFSPAKVINNETRPLRILTVDEAIMKLELSQDQFLVFRSEEDRRLKVMYRTKDGNFGVIEVEA